jgi:hypothetical protein
MYDNDLQTLDYSQTFAALSTAGSYYFAATTCGFTGTKAYFAGALFAVRTEGRLHIA